LDNVGIADRDCDAPAGRDLDAPAERDCDAPADPAVDVFADPVFDLLCRRTPRTSGGLAPVANSETGMIDAVTASLRNLTRSTLAVQGPPGTGKTYLAARVIRGLVERDGWRIGVVAQSHKVVDNVLEGVVAAGLDPAQVGKVPQGGRLDPDA